MSLCPGGGGGGGGGGGVLLKILGMVRVKVRVRVNVIFHTLFQTWPLALRQKFCHHYLD